MARIGYLLIEPKSISNREGLKQLEALECDKIYKDTFDNERTRPEWKEMLRELKRRDELFLLSFHNAVRGPRQLSLLFSLCSVEKIRIVSLRDQIDTWEELFKTKVSHLVDVIGALPGDTLVVRTSSERYINNKRGKKGHRMKAERDQKCIKMYQDGCPIEEIQKETNFSSKSSVFRILKKYGIEISRRKRMNDEKGSDYE